MKVVIQRVKQASVTINNELFSSVGKGYLLLVGFTDTDNETVINQLVKKIVELRIWEDEQGKMNLPITSVNGSLLSVSQFTLYADCVKGRRPSFVQAAKAEVAKSLYELFNKKLKDTGLEVKTGVFQADMKVELINDGPVTIILDSKEVCKL